MSVGSLIGAARQAHARTNGPAGRRILFAFTLVELMVVTGIIALMVSALLPSLANARRQSKAVMCAANLRQISMAMQQYLTSSQGKFPVRSDYSLAPGVDGSGMSQLAPGWWQDPVSGMSFTQTGFNHPYSGNQVRWFDALMPYLNIRGFEMSMGGRSLNNTYAAFNQAANQLWCPEDTSREWISRSRVASYGVPVNVVIAYRLDAPGTGDAMSVPARAHNFGHVKHASEVAFLGELGHASWYHGYAALYESNLSMTAVPGRPDLPVFSHHWKVNYLFFDGHVELRKQAPHGMDYRVISGFYSDPQQTMWKSEGSAAFIARYVQ